MDRADRTDDEIREAAVGAVEVVKGKATAEEIIAAIKELEQYDHGDRSDTACDADV